MNIQTKDRFSNLSNDYGELFTEVFEIQGLNYSDLQKSVFDEVVKLNKNLETNILDIGVGDGETSKLFIEKGYKKLTGIDLNFAMIESAKIKLGNSMTLIKMDAKKMSFARKEFDIIISVATIHNIPKTERTIFRDELLRLEPDYFILGDKIYDLDLVKQQVNYNKEVSAIKEVFGKKHGLYDIEKERVKHYEDDKREKLEIIEIENALSGKYDLKIVYELGMYKTILATKK